MKKIIIAVVAVVVLLVVAMFCLPLFIDINQYRGEILAQLQNRLHRQVKLGAMSLAVFPLRVEVKDVSIGEDPRFPSKLPFAQVGEMDISVKLLPLLTKSVAIDSLTLKRPQIELIKDAAGVWNFASLGQAPATPAAAVPTTPAPAPSRRPPANRHRAPAARSRSTNSKSPTDRSPSPTCRRTSRARSMTTSISPSKTSRRQAVLHRPGGTRSRPRYGNHRAHRQDWPHQSGGDARHPLRRQAEAQ